MRRLPCLLLVLLLPGAALAYRGPAASDNAAAQRAFEQGMVQAWGFNPAEASRAFVAATRADPRCALCWWGLAWSLGPSINSDMARADAPRIASALRRARAQARTPRDRALVAALAARHAGTEPDDDAYAKRMEALARAYPRDAEIAMLAAEAVMNLHPYEWWDLNGRALPWTTAILAYLDRALALEPRHAGALHYRIHVLEPSHDPGRALEDARRLASLAPEAPHLLHMPSHIYMRTGQYAEAVAANQAAIAADARYLAQADASPGYRAGYAAHNQHFLWAAAGMAGQSKVAIAAARAAAPLACGPAGGEAPPHFYVLPFYALVRFGRWQEILDALPPETTHPYPIAMWHYARGTAFARTARLAKARDELAALEARARDPAIVEAKVKRIHPAESLLRIAALTLGADIALAESRTADAVAALQQATAMEDALAYDEPHAWLAPTRHALGAALLAAGRAREAEAAYRHDLRHYPDNAWSLAGLARALAQQGDKSGSADAEQRRMQAARHADVSLNASRF